MKKTLVFLFAVFALTSCKNEANKTTENVDVDSSERTEKQSDGLTLLKGDFVLLDDAAILQTHSEFYGVFITDKAIELDNLVKKYKKADTDMVPVEIRGKISTKEDEKIKWPNKVEIVEILNVYEPKSQGNDIIKLGVK